MKKKGDSEIIAIVLLIMIVLVIIALLILFVMRFLNNQEEELRLRNEMQDTDLNIDDINFDPADNQKLSLLLSKGQGFQMLINLTNETYSYNVTYVNVTVINMSFLNSTLVNITNSTIVNVSRIELVNITNSTIIMVPNSTIINGSDVDIVTVNDVSGSMAPNYGGLLGDKIGESKTATKNFIDLMLNNSGNQVGVVAYDKIVQDSWSHPLSNDSDLLKNIVNLWSPLTSTCTCCGIYRAIDYLKYSSRTKVMVVMSDGVANEKCSVNSPNYVDRHWIGSQYSCISGFFMVNNDPCDDMIEYARVAFETYGITVHTVGFGDPGYLDELTLQKTAQKGNGSYYYADLGELSDIYYQIQQNITTMVPVNISFNQTVEVNVTYEENVTVIYEENITWEENVNVSWWEEINETIEENVTVEVYESKETYSTLKLVFFTKSNTFVEFLNISDLPAPLETKEIEITLDPSWGITTDDIKKVQIYSVSYKSNGDEIISSQPIAVWTRPSLYSIIKFFSRN